MLDFTSTQLDIPYGDSFLLDTRLELRSPPADGAVADEAADTPDGGTQATAHVRVRWLRAPGLGFIRAKIEMQSRESTLVSVRQMLEMAQRYLSTAAAVRGDSSARLVEEEGDDVAREEGPPSEVAPLPPVPEECGAGASSLPPPHGAHHASQVRVRRRDSAVRFGPVAFGAVCDALAVAAHTGARLPDRLCAMQPGAGQQQPRGRWCLCARALRALFALLFCAAVYAVGWRCGSRAEHARDVEL